MLRATNTCSTSLHSIEKLESGDAVPLKFNPHLVNSKHGATVLQLGKPHIAQILRHALLPRVLQRHQKSGTA